MTQQLQNMRVPISATLVGLLLLPIYLAAWGRFGLKVPTAMLISISTGLVLRFYGEYDAKTFPWAIFWVFPLFIPLGMPLWLVPLALLAGWLIAISAFGGPNRNIFNPIALALAFLTIGYGNSVSLLATKPFPGATSAFNIWTSGMNPLEPAMKIWLQRPLNSWLEFFSGGHLPSIPGLAFPGILLIMATLLAVFIPGRRWWFAATLFFTWLSHVVASYFFPGVFPDLANIFGLGVFAAVLLALLADNRSIPLTKGAQILFAAVLVPFVMLFVCISSHELSLAFAILLAQTLHPLCCDVLGVEP